MVCKITANFSNIDLNKLFDYLNFKGEFLFLDNILYFRISDEIIDKNFFIKLKKMLLKNTYIQEINEKNINIIDNNFLSYWIKEGIDNDIKYHIENEEQKTLKEMHDKINTINFLMDKLLEKEIIQKQIGGEENVGK